MRRHVVPVPSRGRRHRLQRADVLGADAAMGDRGEPEIAVFRILAQSFAIPACVGGRRARERRQRFGERAGTGVARRQGDHGRAYLSINA